MPQGQKSCPTRLFIKNKSHPNHKKGLLAATKFIFPSKQGACANYRMYLPYLHHYSLSPRGFRIVLKFEQSVGVKTPIVLEA